MLKKLSKDLSAVSSALKQSEALVVGKASRVRRKVCVLNRRPRPAVPGGNEACFGRVRRGDGWII